MSERSVALTNIWRQVLGNPDLDENSDHFDRGGTSLHILQIIGEVHRVFGVEVKLRDVFFHASPRSLSDFLETKLAPESSSPQDIDS
ncbi:acyl carrier protein [Streptomyces sp. NPDC088190]|uniref:acyl carrier protein n=1 Tax=unclassified Streptomyces TaxID=2593676 RepID=UPI002E7948CB|nr:phosphopantetheine-binding protein [Streptomyces sp. JV190]MEE1838382.1 phosphopantetheine-binding protein [Streptomyces sp. JV190]